MKSVEELDNVQSKGLTPPYVCVVCRTPLPSLGPQRCKVRCLSCDFSHEVSDDYIRYDADSLLKEKYEKDWVLWKVLSNNGFISYIHLKEGSLSLPERSDVNRFREFLERNLHRGYLLDIGCGPLELPGYLMFDDPEGVRRIGLDPIGDIEFKGAKVIGCAEFLPWQDETIDTIVFATSLDHVCSLSTTLQECYRVLSPNGRIVVWMSDRTNRESIFRRLKRKIKKIKNWIKKGYPAHKYTIYPNGIVLYTPDGAIDPYHMYPETPDHLTTVMEETKFRLVDMDYRSSMEVHMCFAKSQ